MQERQDAGHCEFAVQGMADWRTILEKPITLSGIWAEWCGGTKVPYIVYARKEAEVNNQSLERSIVTALLNLGYQLEELEVEFVGEKEAGWGKGVWYKNHDAYEEPLDTIFEGSLINDPSFYHAMFRTENAGDQQFCLYSLQMIAGAAILFHKTLLYRRVVFSPPKAAEQEAAA